MATNRNPIYTVTTYSESFGLDMPKDSLVFCLEDNTIWLVTEDSDTSDTLQGVNKSQLNSQIPTGIIVPFTSSLIHEGWLLCNAQSISRTTYSNLYEVLAPTKTALISIASPAEITISNHGLLSDTVIEFYTTGSLPTGISTGTSYYILSTGMTTSSFRISTSKGGTSVNTSGSQSGTHYIRHFAHGNGNASSTFNTPDYRGIYLRGAGQSGVLYKSKDTGSGTRYPFDGSAVGSYWNDVIFSHRHSVGYGGNSYTDLLVTRNTSGGLYGGSPSGISPQGNLQVLAAITDGTNGTPRSGDETTPAHSSVNYIIKY